MKKQIFLTASAAAVVAQECTAKHHLHDNKCRILSFRGGGVHGAFEAGVIKALAEHMPKEELYYDYIAGVSIGAVNASIFATFDIGQEQEAADYIADMYDGHDSSGLFDFHRPIAIQAFIKSSLADNSPFQKTIESYLDNKPWKRKVSIIAGDILTGQPLFFDETLPLDERSEAIMSSTSIPFVFPPRQIDDMLLVDGGIFANISLGDPIERCREEGYADQDIIVDAILCYGSIQSINEWSLQNENLRWKNAYNFYTRRKAITSSTLETEDFIRLKRGYHDVNFRFAFIPTKELTNGFVAVKASKDEVRQEMWQGYHDASNLVHEHLGDGLTADDHPNPFSAKKHKK